MRRGAPVGSTHPAWEIPDWYSEAACLKCPNDWWFQGGSGFTTGRRKAVATCFRCPVREECLAFAIETGQNHGIWGGLGPKARRQVRKEWEAA